MRVFQKSMWQSKQGYAFCSFSLMMFLVMSVER